VGVARADASPEHATSTTETIVAIAALMAPIPRRFPIGSNIRGARP
jgi:hypothetical protein